ncbi:metal ABC transporter permease [Tenuibacillus multivorans]|uniref:Zinc transport system permease protein n=1 Tax=Tenuibacillus multivorans TaxID=237069 RepID=A0A1H0DBH7_9BACI|nr:metal ABC transporter permease [Tenuibacillus multivorans]GEL76620.1 metal ABC transporter permease [Tenuibacillus multivorans]SDN67520.1 zinc transport system permease protein [Tenuibacillus multivorans]
MLDAFLNYDLLRNTFYAGLLVGLIAPLLGTFIVVRRQSMIADGLSHVTLAGLAFGLLMQKKYTLLVFTPFHTGIAFSIIGALIIENLRDVYKAFQEIAIPIILSLGVGLSIVFIALADGINTDIFSYLFGSVAAVSGADLRLILYISWLVVTFVVFLYKPLFALSFDEEFAKVSGIQAKLIHFLFIVMTALVISASIRIVGVLLVSALMTLPVATSMRIAKSFKQTIIYSIIYGEIAVIIGLTTGYYFEIPPGGTIVITSALLLGFTLLFKRIQFIVGIKRDDRNAA